MFGDTHANGGSSDKHGYTWLSSSLRNENGKLKIFVVRRTLLAKSHRCWIVGTCEPTRCLKPLWRRKREQLKISSWTREILEKAWTIFCPFQAEDTRPDASSAGLTRLDYIFLFGFSFWFRWLESQSSQLQIRNRDPPIDDPHTHRWVHVTKKRQSATDWLLGNLILREAHEKLEYAIEYGDGTAYVWQFENSKSEGCCVYAWKRNELSRGANGAKRKWQRYCTVAKCMGRSGPIWTSVVVCARRLRSVAGSINSGRHILAFTMRRALRKTRFWLRSELP